MNPVTIGRATHIYALCDERGVVRYVGKSVRLPEQRFAQHKTASRRGNLPVNYWLRKHHAATVRLLEIVPPGEDWVSRERYWIEQHDNLLNLTTGGEGLAGLQFSAEHRAKISAALRMGSNFNCEKCGQSFWRKPRDIAAGHNRFCSRRCYSQSLSGVSRPLSEKATKLGIAASAQKRREQTHCKRGHQLSGENLFLTSLGGRGCKECRKIHKKTYLEKANG